MDKLARARVKINEIDALVAKLYEERLDAVCDVIAHKMEHNLPVFDEKREQEVIEKNSKMIKNSNYLPYYKEFLQYMMENSKQYQRKVAGLNVVGYQGCDGAFTHSAAKNIFPSYKTQAFNTFKEVMQALEKGEIPCAVVPFENSYAGEVTDVIDLLLDYDCYIHEIYEFKVSQNLLGLKNANIEDIRQIYSHPQALAQSKVFLDTLDAKTFEFLNTALAGKFVADSKNKSIGAVASSETAKLYDLKILKENINTSSQNTTRFVVLYAKPADSGNRFNAVFKTKHNAGALAKIMSVIGSDGVNVCSIKSKPVPDIPWEYYIYIEIEATLADEKTQILIENIKNECEFFKVIGSYFKD